LAVATAPAVVVPDPPPPGADGRLPLTATPVHYRVALRIDPAQPRFSGVATIQIEVPQPTFYVVLHGRDLAVSGARAHVGTADIPAVTSARIATGGVVPEELVLRFAKALPAGDAEIEITYDAPFAPDLAGLYRVKENGAYYAYTQFESTDARRAFPCFDEPAFKTPYDVTITAPAATMALANSPEASHADAPDGMVVHTFATSRPLPTYLVAFAVGGFDVIEGQTTPFPIRVVTTKGRANLAGLALEVATALVAKLAEYFDIAYPYEKLDLVSVPDFAAGAMENPGLVTFRDVLILIDPKHTTTSLKRSQAVVIAHELAHQWFGNLVTMKWWNDVWLNEGFATWAEAKIVDAWRPAFGATLEQISGLEHVMDTDALKSARAVREPVHSTSDAMEAFDGLTYEKGAAVLRMLEGWLGPDTFRRGVQHYLRENAWKNATADDLFQALDYVSAQRVDRLASGFLDQAGVPQVLTSFTCDAKGGKLELRQSEWRPLGDGGAPPRAWTLPVCVTTDTLRTKSCFTLGSEPMRRDLGPHCPAWVYPNADLAGYYRFVVDKTKLAALGRAAQSLPPSERLGLLSNAWAGVRQGAIGPDALLNLLPVFDGETNRFVIDQLIDVLDGVDRALVEDAARGAFRKYVTARLAARKRALGWWPPSGHEENDDDRALERRSVLFAMGELAEDSETLVEAAKYAAAWLKRPASVSSDTAVVAVPLASMRAGEERLRELRAAATNATTPEDRIIAIRAMGWFDDPAVLRQALDLALGDELKLSELHYLFGAALNHRVARQVLFAWEKENWAKLKERLPGSFGRGMLVDVAAATCTVPERDDARTFFETATQGVEGVKRPLDEALESAGLCIALRESGAAAVSAYLDHRPR
jgi:aminopeptidase N